MFGNADFSARDIFDSVSYLFHSLWGRLDPVLHVVELYADMVGGSILKGGLPPDNGHGPGVDVLNVRHIGEAFDLLAIAQCLGLPLAFAVIAVGRIGIGWGQFLTGAHAQGYFHLPGNPVRVFQVSPLRHVQIDIDGIRIDIGEKFDRLLQPNHVKPDHCHCNKGQERYGHHSQAMVKSAI